MNLPGNCLCGAVLLWLVKGGRIFVVCREGFPHFLLKTRNGEVWHFKLTFDILPWPFAPLLFIGRFTRKK